MFPREPSVRRDNSWVACAAFLAGGAAVAWT